ncbi:MAG TPA: protein kinase [Ktedonobacterales bacterium]|nr:protein kinase [Ktedonobacterales bacterium]
MIDQDQLVGRLLHNRYALDALLATGAAAVVYRGRDTVLNRPVAIKAVPLDAAAPYHAALAQTAAFTHPAVVALYDTFEVEGHLLLIQELVDGRALAAYLRTGLPSERALNIGAQIARALDYAHTHGIVHGDLTPSAVIVDRRAIVRINNVGLPPDSAYFTRLTRALDGDAPTRLVYATPDGEQPPHSDEEDAGGVRWQATARSDVRAAALLLWQVLAEPQAGNGETRVFRADVPEAVRELIWRAALPSRADAIADAETLALALDEALAASARQRPAIPELTPPALQAVRVGGPPSPPPWADDETVATGETWGSATERRPALVAPRHGITPTELGVPHLRLPSRSAEPGGAVRSAERPPQWPAGPSAVGSDGRSHTPARPAGQVNIPLVIAIGIALFVLFFLIGYVAQPIHLP